MSHQELASQVGAFYVAANSWRSELGVVTDSSVEAVDGGTCCAIHRKVEHDVVGAKGCTRWRVGTHPSIAVMYVPGVDNLKCHSEIGQRVLDGRVIVEAKTMSRYGSRAHGLGVVMGPKYFRCYNASVSCYGAGYCYLVAFPGSVRSRAARILGPLPLVVDVLRVMRCIGEPVVSADWLCVGDGLFHVKGRRGQLGDVIGSFFSQGMAVVASCGDGARVGVDPGELSVDRPVGRSGWSPVSRIAGWIMRERRLRDSQEELDEVAFEAVNATFDTVLAGLRGLQQQIEAEIDEPGSAQVGAPRGSMSGKEYCRTCGFFVNPLGHESRCRIQSVDSVLSGSERFDATQMGDAVHRLDVRTFLCSNGTVKREIGPRQDELVSRRSQADWWRKYDGVKEPANGVSDGSCSSAFEASYWGAFRDAYRRDMLDPSVNIPEHVKKFLDF